MADNILTSLEKMTGTQSKDWGVTSDAYQQNKQQIQGAIDKAKATMTTNSPDFSMDAFIGNQAMAKPQAEPKPTTGQNQGSQQAQSQSQQQGQQQNAALNASNVSPDSMQYLPKTADNTDPAMALINQQREQLKLQLEQQKQSIDAQYRQQLATTEQSQKSETGQNRMQLARMGILDTTTGGMAYLNKLEAQHRTEIQQLDQWRSSAISAAEIAMTNGDIALAEKSIKRMEDIDAAKKSAEDKRLENFSKLQQITKLNMEQLAQSGVDPNEIPQEIFDNANARLAEADPDLAMPGLAQSLFSTAYNIQSAKKAEDAQKEQTAYENAYRSSIETGLKLNKDQQFQMTLPDGSHVTVNGFKPDETTKMETSDGQYLLTYDSKGNVVRTVKVGGSQDKIFQNPDTGEITVLKNVNGSWVSSTAFNPGTYNEGNTSYIKGNNLVDNLVLLGGKITQEPGGSFSHKTITGWDIGGLKQGTKFDIPFDNAVVVKTGSFNENVKSGFPKGDLRNYGNYVDLMDVDTGARIRIGHLNSLPNVQLNQAIKKGDLQLEVGNTGYSTGAHVHVESLTADGKSVMPEFGSQQANAKNLSSNTKNQAIQDYEKATNTKVNPASKSQMTEVRKFQLENIKTKETEKKEADKTYRDTIQKVGEDPLWKTQQTAYNSARNAMATIKSQVEAGKGFNDIAALMAYAKIIETTGAGRGVTEGDIKNVLNSVPGAEKLLNIPQSWIKGSQLTQKGRQLLLDAAASQYAASKSSYAKAETDVINNALVRGVKPLDVIVSPSFKSYQVVDLNGNLMAEITSEQLNDPELAEKAKANNYRVIIKK